MPTLIETIFNPEESTGITNVDKTLAIGAINAAAASAAAYLTATLEATTPEVRRLFGEYLTQSLIAHETATGLAVKRDWLNPYASPEEQLKSSYQESEKVIAAQAQ